MHNHHHHHHHHNHGASDNHGFGSQGDVAKMNEEFFDKVADSIFDHPAWKRLAEQIIDELRFQFKWFGVRKAEQGAETRMLDYACGNGVVSKALAPIITTVRGMDISTGMVAQYNKVAREANYTEDKMHAVAGNLLADDAPAEYGDFDLVVISLALHHVADPVEMIRKLSERLAEGGVLIVVDFFSGPEGEPEQPMAIATDNPVRHTVIKSGFREMELKESFEKAGLGAWGWRLFREGSMIPEEFGGDRQLFLAKGSKQTKA